MNLKSLRLILPAIIAGFIGGTSAKAENYPAPRIPYLTDEQAGPKDLVDEIRARRGGNLLNLDRMLLHSPNLAKGWNAMFGAIRNRLSLTPRLRELAIMAIAVLNKADYEWLQHEPEFLAAGGTRAQLNALKSLGSAGPPKGAFDATEEAALKLTIEMTRDVAVRPETMAALRALMSDQSLVELVATIAGYNMVSRFLVATGVGPE